MKTRPEIESELARLERDDGIAVVYACESGSRAWGFESQDSDYDVRFLYVRPAAWYLSIAPGRDVVERPVSDQLDISGWDLRKALQLLRKSNPPLLEWLQSPIVYRQQAAILSRLRALMPRYYSPAVCYFHYLHMAEGNYREYLRGQQVWLKKYFYVLRPVLACRWIERECGVVPMEFSVLVARVVEDDHLGDAIDDLVERKKAGEELDRGPRIPVLSDFLDRESSRLSAKHAMPSVRAPIEPLDEILRFAIAENYGGSIEPSLAVARAQPAASRPSTPAD
jgi:predicted nucleotidyltransferase